MSASGGIALHDPLRLPEPSGAIQAQRVHQHRAVIRRLKKLTHDTYELCVDVISAGHPIHARAGQVATLQFPGVERPRPYSFARDPRAGDGKAFTFFIRQVAGGEVSTWLAEGEREGTEIGIAGPMGNFALDRSERSMLCVAGGSGISAIIAILEQACSAQVERDCVFFYGARTTADLYCGDLIADLKARWHPRHTLQFTQVLSDERADSEWQGPRGLITDYIQRSWLNTEHVNLATSAAFFCGPPPMIEAGVAMLRNAGMALEHIHRDEFEDARSPAPVIDNRRCVLCDECLLVKPVEHCIIETAGLDGGRPIANKPAHS